MMQDFQNLNTSDSCTLVIAHRALSEYLAANGIESASLDARLLLCDACNIRYEQFIAYPDTAISAEQLDLLKSYASRRLSGEPVSRIFGKREFWSLSFALNNATLDPRSDTETLVEFTLDLISQQEDKNQNLRILDLGTGTGCVILSLLSELKSAQGVAVDISLDALKTAKKNAENLSLSDRVNFIQSDWLNGLTGSFDIIVSNPPYIPTNDIAELKPDVKNYDPAKALDGGSDGLSAYREIIHQAYERLSNNALIVFEIGAGQEKDVKNILMSYKTRKTFSNISYKCDLKGVTRCIAAELKNETCGS